MYQTRIGMFIHARKTSETVSRTRICTRSGNNLTGYMIMLFGTEKIILSSKLSKRVKTKKCCEGVVDGR